MFYESLGLFMAGVIEYGQNCSLDIVNMAVPRLGMFLKFSIGMR